MFIYPFLAKKPDVNKTINYHGDLSVIFKYHIYTIPILTWDCIYSKYYKLFVLVEKH